MSSARDFRWGLGRKATALLTNSSSLDWLVRMADEPSIKLVHVTTGANGLTISHRCRVPEMRMRAVSDDIPPVWATEPRQEVVSQSIWVLPAGWRGGWHRNPSRQWVVPISGRWWVETQDGNRVVMGPGDVHLGDDLQGIEDDRGRKGHDSGVIGEDPLVVMVLPLEGKQARQCVDIESIGAASSGLL